MIRQVSKLLSCIQIAVIQGMQIGCLHHLEISTEIMSDARTTATCSFLGITHISGIIYMFFLFSLTYVVGAHWKYLKETLPVSPT